MDRTNQLGNNKLDWRSAALIAGENMASVGPVGYYLWTPEKWLDWFRSQDSALRAKLETLQAGINQLITEAENIYARDKDDRYAQGRAKGMLDTAHDLHRLLNP